jgi:hypothetical protein
MQFWKKNIEEAKAGPLVLDAHGKIKINRLNRT